MRNISEHELNFNQKPQEDMKDSQELSALVVNELFTKLSNICTGSKGEDLEGVKREWLIGLQDGVISSSVQLNFGLKRARERKGDYSVFFPSIGQFVAWCKPLPEDLGLPTADEAYKLAHVMNKKHDPYIPSSKSAGLVINDTLLSIGRDKFRTLSTTDAPKTFKEFYPRSVLRFANGELTEAPKCLEDDSAQTLELKKQQDLVKEEFKGIDSKSAMRSIRRMLG